jgi:hypothetical protein
MVTESAKTDHARLQLSLATHLFLDSLLLHQQFTQSEYITLVLLSLSLPDFG